MCQIFAWGFGRQFSKNSNFFVFGILPAAFIVLIVMTGTGSELQNVKYETSAYYGLSAYAYQIKLFLNPL